MIVLKILAAPVMVALSLLAAMVTFLFCVASAVCELGCIVLTLLSLILFIGGQTVGGIVFLVLAFLVSSFGVPAIAEWLVDSNRKSRQRLDRHGTIVVGSCETFHHYNVQGVK